MTTKNRHTVRWITPPWINHTSLASVKETNVERFDAVAHDMAAAILTQTIDLAATLSPTRVFYIRAGSGRHHSDVFDYTSQLQSSYTSDIDKHFLEAAERVNNANPATKPTWELEKSKWYTSSHVTVTSPANAGGERARWHAPILMYGTTRIKFAEASPHCMHDIEIQPLKLRERGMGFVKDSESYAWQATPRSDTETVELGRMSLYKATALNSGSKKTEVARYRSTTGRFETGGILVVEAREVDVLVAVLTLLATVGQRDSFFVPGARARSSSMVEGNFGGAAVTG